MMRNQLIGVGIAVLALFLAAIALMVGGEPKNFVLYGLVLAPLAILAALAYAGTRSIVAMVFTYAWLAIVAFGVILNVLVSILPLYVKDMALLTRVSRDYGLMSTVGYNDLFKPGLTAALGWTMLLLTVASALSAVTLLKPARILASRIMPIDPNNFVHKIALCIVSLILLTSFVPLIVLGGQPPLLEPMTSGQIQNAVDQSGLVSPLGLVYQFVWTIPAALIAAGWPIARKFREAMVRLGMVRPSLRQALAGVALGLVLVGVGTLLDQGINFVWTSFGWPTTNVEAFNQIMSRLITPLGAVLIGVTAGVGEEIAVRGLLQPRFGLILSNLLFTSLHAFQYGLDGLLSVFLIGLILGIIRSRSNTTTSAIVHGIYDFVLVAMMVKW